MQRELEAESRYREEVELPLLALHATWVGIQSRGKKMRSVEQLLHGQKPQMSRMEMIANLEQVHQEALERIEKENAGRNEGR